MRASPIGKYFPRVLETFRAGDLAHGFQIWGWFLGATEWQHGEERRQWTGFFVFAVCEHRTMASCYAENSEGERLGRRRKVVPVVEEEKVVLVPVVVVGRRGGGAARSLGWSVG